MSVCTIRDELTALLLAGRKHTPYSVALFLPLQSIYSVRCGLVPLGSGNVAISKKAVVLVSRKPLVCQDSHHKYFLKRGLWK